MNEKIKELIKLSEENPYLKIISMVDTEVCGGDDYSHWVGNIESVKKDIYWQDDDNLLVGKSRIADKLDLEYIGDDSSEEYVNKRFEELKKNKEIKEAIFIFIGLPDIN